MPLSDTWLKAQSGKPRDKVEVKTDRDALSVRISPKGKIVFQMRYRYAGKACRLDLGSYPLMSLKAARERCTQLRAQLEKGHNPKVVVMLEKKEIQTATTLEEVFEEWYLGYCKPKKKNHSKIHRSFELHVFPALGRLPANEVTLHDWIDLLEGLAKGVPGIALRILANAKQMYKWGIRRRLVKDNPLANIMALEDLHIRTRKVKRILDDEEIRWFWQAIEQSNMAEKNGVFLKLCLVYGCRCGELRLAEKSHFDFDKRIWTVPPENHKIGYLTEQPLVRPIIESTEELIQKALQLSGRGKFVFKNYGTNEPLSEQAVPHLPGVVRRWVSKHLGREMPHWTVHDLRRTARTNFSPLTEPHVAEIMLGHMLPGEWQTYDQFTYLDQQRLAYEKWWDRLMGIVNQAA